MWFYWQRQFHGGYAAAKGSTDPGTLTSMRGRTRGVVKLKPEEYEDDLTALEARYPLKADVTTVELASDEGPVDEV